MVSFLATDPDPDPGPDPPPKKQTALGKLADGKERAIQHMVMTSFWVPDGAPCHRRSS